MTPADLQAWAAIAQTLLAAALVLVTVGYVIYSARTVAELRESRVGAYLPLLQWQTPRASVQHDLASAGGQQTTRAVLKIVSVVLWNIGPGAARILRASATSDAGEAYGTTLSVPSTIPSGNQTEQIYTLRVAPQSFQPAPLTLTVAVRYADVLEHRVYETRIRVLVRFQDAPPAYPPQLVNVAAEFLDSDERSASQRRIRKA